jgi:hypothetical protein
VSMRRVPHTVPCGFVRAGSDYALRAFRQEGEAGTDAGCDKKNRGTDAAIFFTARFFARQKNVPPLAPAVRRTCMAAHRKKTRSRTPVSEPCVFYPLREKGGAGAAGGR